jgi:hypothetical protein
MPANLGMFICLDHSVQLLGKLLAKVIVGAARIFYIQARQK